MSKTLLGSGSKTHCFMAIIPIPHGVEVAEGQFIHGAIFKLVEQRIHRRWQPTDFISVGRVKHVTPIPMGHSTGDAFQIVSVCNEPFQPINGTPEEFVAALIDELKPHVPYDRSRPATVYFDGKVWPIPGMRQEKQVA